MKRMAVMLIWLAVVGMITGIARADLKADTPYGLDDLREKYKKEAGDPLDNIALGISLFEAVRDLHDSYEALDESVDIDLSAANTPRVPSSCAESEDCGACYEQAQRKLNRVRVALERNRVIGVQTKAMKDDAMAVGQSFASFPGMGIGWYAARRDILAGWQSFINSYDAKYEELLGGLLTALEEIGACEAEYFNQPDWFDRFGFIYHQFMEDRYHSGSVLN